MVVEDSISDKNISYKRLRIGVQSPEHTYKTSCSRFVLTVLQYLDGSWREENYYQLVGHLARNTQHNNNN